MPKRKNIIQVLLFIFIAGLSFSQTDPLPSWNETPVKKAITDYVTKITTEGSADYIPDKDRISTFDNDGTLWPEQPVIQGLFMIHHMQKLIAKDPSLKYNPTVKAVLEKDKEYFSDDPLKRVLEIMSITMTNMSEDEFEMAANEFFQTSAYPKLNQPITNLAYQPQLELLNFLRSNGFKTYICSGGTVEFMRRITEQMYGIPPEQVIGSSFKYKFIDHIDSNYILREPELIVINDKEGKPANIQLLIGKRPVFVAGNVRSGGDIAMMRFSQGSKYPNFQLLINHDDADREFAYEEKDRYSLNSAEKYGFNVVSMKNDWKKVFGWEK